MRGPEFVPAARLNPRARDPRPAARVWHNGWRHAKKNREGPMAEQKRADYASTRDRALGAWVAAVEEGSPAWEAGIEPGMRIARVNGVEPRDLIDWRWEADGASCELEVYDPADGTTTPCELWREPGQDWGIDFTDVLFDGFVGNSDIYRKVAALVLVKVDAQAHVIQQFRDDAGDVFGYCDFAVDDFAFGFQIVGARCQRECTRNHDKVLFYA